MKKRVAVLISGNGSNLKALYKATKDNQDYPAEISLVLSNKESALGIEFAKVNNIKNKVINHKDFKSREEFEKKMIDIIDENNIDIICLAGFMRLLSKFFIDKYQGRIINIHPSLLPAFKGGNAIEDAFNYGVKITGCTVHFVTEEMDAGPIILQSAVNIEEDDNIDKIKEKIHQQEHIIFPKALEIIAKKL